MMVIRKCLTCGRDTVYHYCDECAAKILAKRKPRWLRLYQRIKYGSELRWFHHNFTCRIFKHDWDDGNYEPYSLGVLSVRRG